MYDIIYLSTFVDCCCGGNVAYGDTVYLSISTCVVGCCGGIGGCCGA